MAVSVGEHTLTASFDNAVAGTTAILKALSEAGFTTSGEPMPVPSPAPAGLRVDSP